MKIVGHSVKMLISIEDMIKMYPGCSFAGLHNGNEVSFVIDGSAFSLLTDIAVKAVTSCTITIGPKEIIIT